MQLLTLTGFGFSSTIAAIPEGIKASLNDLSPLLKEIAEEVIQPAFARNYDRSGLKVRSGTLKTAVSKTGARGNLLEIRPHSLSAGVDYNTLPYARYAIEGRGPVVPRNKKALFFYDQNGKPVLVKRVKAVPPHDIFYLTEADFERIGVLLAEKLVALGAQSLSK
jgi:hypothetical protein